jgi:hypothetical protein
MDGDSEPGRMIEFHRPLEDIKRRVDMREKRPAERRLIPERHGDGLRCNPARQRAEPDYCADRGEHGAERIALALR